ncbi:hypothetical protein IF2G_03006 [Cordyceps javanica]|nr:hypothetical protein IF2G_03006 [Cordyceps javanica]
MAQPTWNRCLVRQQVRNTQVACLLANMRHTASRIIRRNQPPPAPQARIRLQSPSECASKTDILPCLLGIHTRPASDSRLNHSTTPDYGVLTRRIRCPLLR